MVNAMDYENMLKDSFAYTKEGVFDKINRWVLLIIGTIILTIPLLGYVAKIFRAEKPAPEVQNWGSLFVDGIKLLIVEIVYFIPVMILWAIMMFVLGSGVSPAGNPYGAYGMTPMAGVAGAGAFSIIIFIVYIVIAILLPVALIRFARSGNFGDTFDFHAIFDRIGKIGWVQLHHCPDHRGIGGRYSALHHYVHHQHHYYGRDGIFGSDGFTSDHGDHLSDPCPSDCCFHGPLHDIGF